MFLIGSYASMKKCMGNVISTKGMHLMNRNFFWSKQLNIKTAPSVMALALFVSFSPNAQTFPTCTIRDIFLSKSQGKDGTDNLIRTTLKESWTVPVLELFPLWLGKFKMEGLLWF